MLQKGQDQIMYYVCNFELRKFAHVFKLRGSVSKGKERLKMQEGKKKEVTNEVNSLLEGNTFRKENKGGKQECG